jgi:hypothetical protein
MKLRIYALRITVALTTFGLCVGLFEIGRCLTADSQPKTEEASTDQPVEKELPDVLPTEVTVFPPHVEQTPTIYPTGTEEKTEYEFDAGNDYYIIGKLPKAFRDFENLSIVTRDYENTSEENNYEGVPIPPRGFFLAKKEFDFTRINIANRQIVFETEAKKGVSYQFVGEFTDEEAIESKDKDGYEYTEYAVLKGRLKKMRDGKKIAESEVKFAIMHGC